MVVPLDETALGLQLLESLLGDIVVVDTILLAGSRAAGGMRHGKREGIGVSLEEELEEGALADARRAGDNKGATIGRENWQGSRVSTGRGSWLVTLQVSGKAYWEPLCGWDASEESS